jgi:elongation factor P
MAELIDAIDLRPGMTYLDNGKIYKVLENTFNKTSMAKAVVKCKVKNLRNGSITVEVVSGQKFEKADLNSTVLSFSYVDGTNLVFMDGETYETIEIPETKLADEKKYIFEGSTVKALKYGDEILDIVLPDQVVVELFDAEDAVQGNSVQSAQKKA